MDEFDYRRFTRDAWQIADDHGWHETVRSPWELCALVHSEISEALEAYRRGEPTFHMVDGKPEGLTVELADALIRCADWAYANGSTGPLGVGERYPGQSVPVRLGILHWRISETMASTSVPWGHKAARMLSEVEAAIVDLGLAHEITAAVAAKMAYNHTRPYRHGGKRA